MGISLRPLALPQSSNQNELPGKSTTDDTQAIKKAAQQFESLFIQMMLKSMRQASVGQNTLFDESKMTQYRDLYDTELSKELANGKGIGLADMITRQLQAKSTPSAQPEPFIRPSLLGHYQTNSLQPYIKPSASTLSVDAHDALATLFGGDEALISEAPAADAAPRDIKAERWNNPDEFVRVLWPHAEQAAKRINADPRALIAQAALETGWGRHVMRGADGRSSYNLFGIKADSSWDGRKVTVPTLEFEQGAMRRRVASFRAYDSVGQAFDDYVTFLQSNPRYTEALQAAPSAKHYLRELQAAGYATDPDYAHKIQRVIESPVLREHSAQLKNNSVMPLTSERVPATPNGAKPDPMPPVSIST